MGKNLVKERVKEILEENSHSINSIHREIRIPQTTLNNQINGNSNISLDTVLAINGKFENISLEWLLTGKGEKYKTDSNKIVENDKNNFMMVPQYSLDVSGGTKNTELDSFGYLIGYTPFSMGREHDICCPVTGRSMYPDYPPGCLVLLRPVKDWRDFLELGRVYVLELEDGRRLIKELRKGKDKEHFTIHSRNDNYEDMDIPKRIIIRIYLVIAKYENELM